MTSRSALVLGSLAAAVVTGGIALAVAVRSPPPVAASSPSASGEIAAPRPAQARPAAPAAVPAGGYTKFVPRPGATARTYDAAKRTPIPAGGFAAWTGREGTAPGEIEEYATVAGLRLPVALEQRRSTVLGERTADTKLLGEILGAPPSAEMLEAIHTHAAVLHDTTANIQVGAREGTLSDQAAIDQTRSAEDAYRRAYQTATGLTDQQFDRFFAPP